ncbi:MAG: ferric reductase-like transmembrane domain-containing protein [Candidatus Daviesbacteria bacterium]|nr:ferric reductase-like transmembrane domain-containing protein [Candidatus Daviesbacteria bacterium]
MINPKMNLPTTLRSGYLLAHGLRPLFQNPRRYCRGFLAIKLLVKTIILASLLFVLIAPLILLNQGLAFKKTSDLLFFLHRGLGIYAFSLIFLALLMGSTISLLDRFFTPGKAFVTHRIIAIVAFVLSLLHPLFLFSTYLSEGNLSYIIPFQTGTNLFYFFLGIFALMLLILTVTSALLRFRLGPKWLFIHRFNYLIFWLIFFHGLNLGVDTKTSFAGFLYLTYGAIVGIVTIRRLLIYRI